MLVNRRKFLKNIGIGAAVLPIAPVVAESVVHFPNDQYLGDAYKFVVNEFAKGTKSVEIISTPKGTVLFADIVKQMRQTKINIAKKAFEESTWPSLQQP